MHKLAPGQRYGKLTVLEYDKPSGLWLCRCDCGKTMLRGTTGIRPTSQCMECYRKSPNFISWQKAGFPLGG